MNETEDRLKQAEAFLQDARDWIMGCIGSSYCETNKGDEDFVDDIDSFLGAASLTDWKNINN